jgi:subtilisin family serine protease
MPAVPDVRIPPILISTMDAVKPSEGGRTWMVEDVGLPAVWESLRGKLPRKVKVAVLDTGVDESHAQRGDLKGVVAEAASWVTGGDWRDKHGHGSHCASILAANDDGETMAGVAAGFVELYCGKVLTDEGSGQYAWINRGIQWAIERRVDVISMSLGGPVPSPTMERLLSMAAEAGIYVVCAAGNEGQSGTGYPGSYPFVFCVGAVDRNRQVASWSSRGQAVDCVGFGVDILGCWTEGRYATISGTSMATPFVAGLCALRRARELVTGQQVTRGMDVLERIASYCDDLGEQGADVDYGHGFLSPQKLLVLTPPHPKLYRVKGTSVVVQEDALEPFSGSLHAS